MQRPLIDYIRRPDSMDAQAIAHLRNVVEQYPYFHGARILLLQALYRNRDASFHAQLRACAPMVPNRQAIFHLVEEKGYSADEERHKFDSDTLADDGTDRTGNLIDLFLQSLPAEKSDHGPLPVDATQDYIGYLMQTEGQEATEAPAPALAGGEIIENFLESGAGRITLSADSAPETPRPAHAADAHEGEASSNDFLTETLAGIYIKQGKYESAAKIIQKISLNNPKKSRYFADQLRFLEKLIINNKHK